MANGSIGIDPIIVLGMHRSGTTMLSRLLQELDGHLGADLCRETLESFSFMRLNNNLLHEWNAAWHTPQPVWQMLNDDQHVEELAARLHSQLSEGSLVEYWGNDHSRTSAPFWGWKDPRNTLTLPIWRRVFPDAKIIYIVRNGIDVAQSLVKRDQQNYQSWVRTAVKNALVHVFRKRWPEFKPRPFTMKSAFELWAEYLQFADYNTKEIQDERILRLRYEDLLSEPLASLQRIADFVTAEPADRALVQLAERINTRRRFAFVTDPQLCEFYNRHREHPQMVNHGYDQILVQDNVSDD